ncbi:N-methylhydantoinase B [hydrothermal vent metagenome]|uniref:N-methylhydantoinase B n=1 Tax=hydrothermal vent metagenome TaxID=652676 RepID=A0A3B0YSZ0_9ZZZZ
MNLVDLSVFSSRIVAICDEMGATLCSSAFSPNIKDRLDYSCAIFDHNGELCAQAAHIPVHLGSMAYAMTTIVASLSWESGDTVIMNDPYLGGTHLPDVTLISAVHINQQLVGFVANRAHHADIGSDSPGSMPLSSTLEEEGIIIEPDYLFKKGQLNVSLFDSIIAQTANPVGSRGDFSAQISANLVGVKRLTTLINEQATTPITTETIKQKERQHDSQCIVHYQNKLQALDHYAQRLALSSLQQLPKGVYEYTDFMDDDGMGQQDIKIQVCINISDKNIDVDFSGTAKQVRGNINCPLSVTAAAVYYVFRCLMPAQTPASAGSFRHINISAPDACLLNACRPAAVAAGNVETSTRIVDVLLGALAKAVPEKIPAASHGSMNNLAMGAHYKKNNNRHSSWSYYETIGGGMGAGATGGGLSAVQTHMTNTLNTPVEVLESEYPLRVRRYQLRQGSGGNGKNRGGEGIIREFEFLAAATFTLLTERRSYQPWGLADAESGQCGVNYLNGKEIMAKVSCNVKMGDCLMIKTAGGGGYGKSE